MSWWNKQVPDGTNFEALEERARSDRWKARAEEAKQLVENIAEMHAHAVADTATGSIMELTPLMRWKCRACEQVWPCVTFQMATGQRLRPLALQGLNELKRVETVQEFASLPDGTIVVDEKKKVVGQKKDEPLDTAAMFADGGYYRNADIPMPLTVVGWIEECRHPASREE